MRDPAESLLRAELPLSRDELLGYTGVARAWLDAVIAGSTRDALAARRDAAGWRPLDHLLHIAAWERMIVAHLTSGNEHEIAGVDRARFDAMPLDELNNVLYRRSLALAPDAAMAEYRDAHDVITEHVRTMADASFGVPYWEDEPDGRTVMEKVAGDTYRHYIEHGVWIREMLGGGR